MHKVDIKHVLRKLLKIHVDDGHVIREGGILKCIHSFFNEIALH